MCAGNVEASVDQFPADLTEDLAGVLSNLREATKVGEITPVFGGRLNWAIGQGTKEVIHYFNKLVTKIAARL